MGVENLMMKVSKAGIDLVKEAEGLRLDKYFDSAGFPTIGYGHLIGNTEDLEVISASDAEDLLVKDLKSAEICVNLMVKTKLTQNQFDALVSFVFNIGCTKFKTSTMLKFINQGKFIEAANEFKRWNKMFDTHNKQYKEVLGLTKRREREKILFLLRD